MELKYRLTTASVLTVPNSLKPYVVDTDASDLDWDAYLCKMAK